MQINIDPMAQLRADAVDKINGRFAAIAIGAMHREQAHARKLEIAKIVVRGGDHYHQSALDAEAALRGVSTLDLAKQIVSNATISDPVMERELERQMLLAAVRNAANPAAIEQVMTNAGFPQPDNGFRLL